MGLQSQAEFALRDRASEAVPTLVIRPSGGWRPLNLRDLWHYRELLYFLTWRDIKALRLALCALREMERVSADIV